MNKEEKERIDFLSKIGNRLKSLRKLRGFKNSDEFAYEKGINRSQYGKYEAGRLDMQVSTLLKIVKALDISLEEFFSEGFD